MPNPSICTPIIALHRSPLSQKFGVPRQSNLVAITSQIVMQPPFDTMDAFVGITAYSHLWLIWQFHHNKTQTHFRPQVRPPRLGGNDKMGVFATRSMYRPSALGLSVVQLIGVDCQDNGHGVVLHIKGADMIDGTPIIDIKPYLPYSDSPHATAPMDKPTAKTTAISPSAQQQFDTLIDRQILSCNDIDTICQLIAQDPRPAYRQNDTNHRFAMRYQGVDVQFFMDDIGKLMIDDIKLVL